MSNVQLLTDFELCKTIGGGNALDCAAGVGASAAVLGATASGPVGWALLGVAAAASGFATGWSCTSWGIKGDQEEIE